MFSVFKFPRHQRVPRALEDGGRRYGKVTTTTQAASESWYGAPSPLRLRGRPLSLHGVMGTFMLGTRCSAYVPVGYRILGSLRLLFPSCWWLILLGAGRLLCRALFEMGHRKLHFETKYRGTGSAQIRSRRSWTAAALLVIAAHF